MTSELKQTEAELAEHGYHLDSNNKAIDLVCGMELERAERVSRRRGEVYYFCSRWCKEHFDANPEMYIGEEAA